MNNVQFLHKTTQELASESAYVFQTSTVYGQLKYNRLRMTIVKFVDKVIDNLTYN